MVNNKKRLLASILAASSILTFSGCAERVDDENSGNPGNANDSSIVESNDAGTKNNENNSDNNSDASKPDDVSEPAVSETTVVDDLKALSQLKSATSCDIDAKIEISGVSIDTNAAISYDAEDNLVSVDLKSLDLVNASDATTEPQTIKLGKANILVDMNDKTGYFDLDFVYELMAMSGEDPEQVKAQFESAYPDAKYMKVDLSDSVDDITSSAGINMTVTPPEGVSEENLKSWFETSCKSILEQYLKPIKSEFDSEAPSGMHGLVFNNNNLIKLLGTCDDMVSSENFRNCMYELYDMSSDKTSIETLKSEYDSNLTECKDFIADAIEFLSDKADDNKIDFEIATLVNTDSARITLDGDFDIVASGTSGSDFDTDSTALYTLDTAPTAATATAPDAPVTRMQANFDIDIGISTTPVDLEIPGAGKYIDSTASGSGSGSETPEIAPAY